MSRAGIYIHVPFCASKCPYCDFYSVSSKNGTARYTEALIDEIRTLRRNAGFLPDDFREREITSLYFGGGTPSAMPAEELGSVINEVRNCFRLSPDAEITVECNPSSDNLVEKLKTMADSGVNRISLGMQSAVDEERKKLGRKADRQGIIKAVAAAKEAGISDISLDVMLGIPLQTKDSLEETLEFALSQGITHLSAYMLQLEDGTWFARNEKKLNLPDEDFVAELYLFMCDYLKKAGMRHYEISNFCFGDHISRHNMKYWDMTEYLGIGPSAHSFVNGKRFFHPADIQGFIDGATAESEGEGGSYEEEIMLGLRTDRGIIIPEGTEGLCESLRANGLAVIRDNRISLTDKGMLISNTVITEILSEM